MPAGPERDAAYRAFLERVEVYKQERLTLLNVPAPTIAALAYKMRVASSCDIEQYELCLRDAERLALVEALSSTALFPSDTAQRDVIS